MDDHDIVDGSTEDDEVSGDDLLSESTESDMTDDDAASKRKRKKKKKKKKSSAATADGNSTPDNSVDKVEADKRFQAAMEAVKSGDEMWLSLSNSNIRDAKAKKLMDALKSNASITSVDLSCNLLGQEGLQAIISTLESGGAPELISLNLRGNDISDEALSSLAAVQKQRKLLNIETGPLPSPDVAASTSASDQPPGNRSGNSSALASPSSGRAAASSKGPGSPGGLQDFTKSPMFRRYFQSPDEADEAAAPDESRVPTDPVLPPEQLWAQVRALLAPASSASSSNSSSGSSTTEGSSSQGAAATAATAPTTAPALVAAIPSLSRLLVALSKALEGEISSISMDESSLYDFKPHIRHTLLNLDALCAVLDIVPPPVQVQYSNELQPAVGSHRMWVADSLSLLVLASSHSIDHAIAGARLLPKLLALVQGHPNCSALHSRVLQVLRSSCRGVADGLWGPLLQPEPQSADTASGGGSGGDARACRPLHSWLIEVAEANVDLPVGRRSACVGFVTEATQVLMSCCQEEEEVHNAVVAEYLREQPTWQAAVGAGGVLRRLLQEQEGDLCGPRPERREPEPDPQDAGGPEIMVPGGVNPLTGAQLMALLQGMSAVLS